MITTSIQDLPHPLPLYFKIELDLRARIESGEFPPAGRFLTAPEICEAYGVSMITARRAMRNLAEKNYITSVQGRGSTVCSPLPELASSLRSQPRSGVTLRIIARSPFIGLFTSTQFRNLLAGSFPDLHLEIIDADTNEPLKTEIDRADLVTVIDFDYRALREGGHLVPLAQLADAPTLSSIRADLLPEIPKILGEAADYMLPLTCAPIVLIYNRDLLAQGGVAPEFGLSTVEEFVSTCRRLKEGFRKNQIRGVAPLLIELNHYRRWPLAVYWNGGKLWSKDGKRCLLEAAEVQEAFAWYHEILVKEQIAVNSFSFSGTLEENLFSQGKLAFHFGSYTTLHNYQQHCAFDYGIARIPAGKQRATLAVQGSIAVCQGSQQKQLAFKFAQFLLSAEVQKIIHQRAHLPSSREALERWSLEEASPAQRNQLRLILESMADAVPLEYPETVETVEHLSELMSQVWLDLEHAPEICRELSLTLRQEPARQARGTACVL